MISGARRALFEITAAGLTALEWRRKHGDWPPSLDATGVVAIDPFTGQPLGYEKKDDGSLRIFAQAPERFEQLPWLLPD